MICLSTFKSGYLIFISAAEEIRRNRTGLAVQFPPFSSVVVFAVGYIAGEYGFVAVLKLTVASSISTTSMTVTVDAVIVLTAGTYMKPSTKYADTFCPFTVTIVSLLKEYPSLV